MVVVVQGAMAVLAEPLAALVAQAVPELLRVVVAAAGAQAVRPTEHPVTAHAAKL